MSDCAEDDDIRRRTRQGGEDMNARRFARWKAVAGLVAAAAFLVAACGTTESTAQAIRPAPPPDTSNIPTSYTPKPGDLLFYTNGSISYNSTAKHPWVIVIDAKTKKILAASEISDVSSSPHGLGASPDGTKLYLPAGIGQAIPATGLPAGATVQFGNGVTVIDALTLKSTQAIPTLDAPHHIQVLNDRDVMVDAWGTKQVLFTLDPSLDNKMTHELAASAFGGRSYIGFPSPDGKFVYMTVRPPKDAAEKEAWIGRVNLTDWSVERVATVGAGAVWTAFSRDGAFAYVTLGEEDWVVKVDLAQQKVVAKAATGRGPYGVVLSPDESRLYVVSKGEGGRGQRGGTFVEIDAQTMRVLQERPSCKAFVCQADHVLVSPDGTELWISNNMGYITVFDLKTLDMKAEITTPFLADPHGGVFIQYDKDGRGHVVMDIGGPHGGVSPYSFDNQHGIPTLAAALENGWAPAAASSPLALTPGSAAAGTQTQGQAQVPAIATTVNLVMQDFLFEPKDVAVPAGAQVTFKITNDGQAVHNFGIPELNLAPVDVTANGLGEVSWTAPTQPGSYEFVCTYHPGMEGVITVR